MTEATLEIIRPIFFVGAVANALQATVLFEWSQRTFTAKLATFGARTGKPLPAWVLDRRVQRAGAVIGTGLFAALWWFLGTPAGVTWFTTELK